MDVEEAENTLAAVSRAECLVTEPHGRRKLWLCVVTKCPLCGGLHVHRAVLPSLLFHDQAERECPTTGRIYILKPVESRKPDADKLAAQAAELLALESAI